MNYKSPNVTIYLQRKNIMKNKPKAFSLVEMLMALLVASLLLAALAPVMTRKMSENIEIKGSFDVTNKDLITKEITYQDCLNNGGTEMTASDGSVFCETEFVVPSGYNAPMMVTLVSAGGGGGTAATAGYTEFTTVGSHTFTVPDMVDKLEVTLISGGAGGGAGGQTVKTQTFITSGNGGITNKTVNDTITVNSTGKGTWAIPEAAKNRNILASACGGGGGGGASSGSIYAPIGPDFYGKGYGGGTGGYVLNELLNFANASSFTYYIGGGGGGGGGVYRAGYGQNGQAYGGGGGGGGGKGANDAGGSEPNSGGHARYPATSGKLETKALIGGNGGKGVADGVKLPVLSGYDSPLIYTSGGNGGQPAGGAGGLAHWHYCGHAGGGGGGGAASQIVIGSGIYLNAPGGGGGASWLMATGREYCLDRTVAGGGGGGGTGGGVGGGLDNIYAGLPGTGGIGGANGINNIGGTINTIFGANYCNGGNGGQYTGDPVVAANHKVGGNGLNGAIRLTYLDYGFGGGGGGAAAIVPLQTVKVSPKDMLTIGIGLPGEGVVAGKIASDKSIEQPEFVTNVFWKEEIAKYFGKESYINDKNGIRLLRTGVDEGGGWTALPGCSSEASSQQPFCSYCGHITNGMAPFDDIAKNGFLRSTGKRSSSNIGGDGGVATTPWFTCTPGKGGTKSSPVGGDASGYGCGGGGGYGLHNGGKGSGGYARLSWNLYWDTVANMYKRAETGSGGGGAAGSAMTYSVSGISGMPISVRIGKGGGGAYVADNKIFSALKGGDTVFGSGASGELRVRGGNAGVSPSFKNNTLANGVGGSVPNTKICTYDNADYTKRDVYCTKGAAGSTPENSSGGNGGSLNTFGTGGAGGVQDTGDNSKGASATGFGGGGGGAAIREISGSIATGNVLSNPNRGGNGTDGKIIIKMIKF